AAVLERLLEAPGRGDELSAEMYDLALAAIAEGATPRIGAVELVGQLRSRLPLAVASNAPRRHLRAGLSRVGRQDALDAVVTVEDVARPKPAPDLYARACELLGVRPADAVALEDSPPGAAAARAAGMYVIGIPSVAGVALEADLVAASPTDAA